MELVALAIILSSMELCYGAMSLQDYARCNANTLPLRKLGNKCYYFEVIAKENWYGANYFCNYRGMRLASIESETENTALGEHVKTLTRLPEGQRIWTSGSDLSKTDRWYRSSIGKRFAYANWTPTQPTGGDEHCLDVSLVDGRLLWNDLPCDWELPFICEINPFADNKQLC